MSTFFVYIIYSEFLDKFYVGYTGDDLTRRIEKHNAIHRGFTGRTNDWVLKYAESFSDKAQAMDREKQIKKWKSRALLIKLIAG